MRFKDFNEEKLAIIENGVNNGLNILEFANPELSAEELRFEYVIRLMAKKRDYKPILEMSLGVCGYDYEQLKEFSNAYRLKLDINVLKEYTYTAKQMKEIRIAMQKGEEYQYILNPKMEYSHMHKVRMSLKKDEFTDRQKEVINKARKEGFDTSLFAFPHFSYTKMKNALTDLRAGRDLEYLKGNYSSMHIKLIRKAMIDGKDPKSLYHPKMSIAAARRAFRKLYQ